MANDSNAKPNQRRLPLSGVAISDEPTIERLTKLKHSPRPPSDEKEWTESEVRRGLDQFVTALETGALGAAREGLTLDDLDDYVFLRRQKDLLVASVADLKALLVDHLDSAVRADRLLTLYQALGSAAVIARRALEDPAADYRHDRRRDRLRTATARERKSAKSRRREDIIIKIAEAYPGKTAHQTANKEFVERVNARLQRAGLKPLADDTIYRCVKEHWQRIAPSLRKR
jgi:hypothetical protein